MPRKATFTARWQRRGQGSLLLFQSGPTHNRRSQAALNGVGDDAPRGHHSKSNSAMKLLIFRCCSLS
jgi:hypothetical protein